MNLWVVFLTGLTTGGLTCLAMQGGLLASVITTQKDSKLNKKSRGQGISSEDWLPVTLFLSAKLLSHVILGALLGLLGSVISLSVGAKIFFQTFTALFMLATAGNLLDLHPIFRYVVIQPPKFIQRRVRRLSKDASLFAPAFLGFFTVVVPCGITQAMEVIAINSGNPVEGALIMGAFVLGTSPLFTLIGIATSKLSDLWREKFLRIAAYSLIAMSLYALNGVLVVLDSPISAQKLMGTYQKLKAFESGDVAGATSAKTIQNKQAVTINIAQSGYTPNYITVKKNIPVELTLKSSGVYSCASAFVFREFGISAMLKPTDTKSFTFTPTKPGRFTFSCSMGMYSGIMEVI
jgi:sulfite exporter TauE/SafE